MERTRYLIVGAGVSGLAFADRLGRRDYRVVEAEQEIGGYCRTVKRDGFTWDYAGHFFHFRQPEIETELVRRIKGRVLKVRRDARIWYADRLIDFPFQANIRQLPSAEFEECARDLRARPGACCGDFKEMLYARYGRAIAEKFLIPYNEKLYATDLASLDVDAMGRFFPHVDADRILDRSVSVESLGYNATFSYPEGGAIEYVEALATNIPGDRISLGERVVSVDLGRRVARTTKRRIAFDHLVSSVPLVSLLRLCGLDFEPGAFTWNKVLVFNLGFDAKGLDGVHWIYFPQRELCFYRVGFYDNIFGSDRMSLYVEIGLPSDAPLSEGYEAQWLSRVLHDLRACEVRGRQRLVASHHVVLDPAYVHITKLSNDETRRCKAQLAESCVHSIGRYGSWRYCSIEDNIVEARALADQLS